MKQYKVNKATLNFISYYLVPNSLSQITNKSFDVMIKKNVDWDYIKEYIKSMDYNVFLKTDYWAIITKQVKRNKQCVLCGNTKTLRCHHTTYNIRGEEHKHLEKLICVCDKCHKNIHNKEN